MAARVSVAAQGRCSRRRGCRGCRGRAFVAACAPSDTPVVIAATRCRRPAGRPEPPARPPPRRGSSSGPRARRAQPRPPGYGGAVPPARGRAPSRRRRGRSTRSILPHAPGRGLHRRLRVPGPDAAAEAAADQAAYLATGPASVQSPFGARHIIRLVGSTVVLVLVGAGGRRRTRGSRTSRPRSRRSARACRSRPDAAR